MLMHFTSVRIHRNKSPSSFCTKSQTLKVLKCGSAGPPMTLRNKRIICSAPLKSQVRKRSVNFRGQKTSVSLEAGFWNALREIAPIKELTVHELVLNIDNERADANLSSAIRLHMTAVRP
jgi:predicted DNA-binding ribbon-helix-helix protein